MTKLFVHAKLLIDGISATPKFDQLISIEDDKIKAIEDYHEIHEDVIEVNTITPCPHPLSCRIRLKKRI